MQYPIKLPESANERVLVGDPSGSTASGIQDIGEYQLKVAMTKFGDHNAPVQSQRAHAEITVS